MIFIWLIINFWIMSKHFEMYVKINNVIGEKKINLTYSVKNLDSSKEVAIISVFSDNVQYKFMKPWDDRIEIRE